MDIQTVGVVGAGVMGVGVAQNLAQTGHTVILVDISAAALEHAEKAIRENLRLQRLFQRDLPAEEADAVLARITFTTDYQTLARAEFVIENVPEKWPLKRQVYAQLDAICSPDCIFAANTSAIPITRIASATQRPERVIGTHFMNPVPLKPVVEVIRGVHTSDETFEATNRLLAQMGKEGIPVGDAPGFVSNRVLMLTINEAVYLLMEQVASAETVDRIFKTCFGHKMGPLETADLIGLDTVLDSIQVLYNSFRDSKYRPCPLLQKMVDAGFYGQKNGYGFYRYPVKN